MKTIYEERIRELYPELEINQIEENDIGQNNDVLIVNNTLVFRFPKYIGGIKKLEKETKVLDYLKDKISLSIPYPHYRSFEPSEVGKVFTGYQLIQGTPLWPGVMKKTNNEEYIQKITSQLVQFLTELHSKPIDNIGVEKQGIADIRKSIEELYDRFQKKLFPYMNGEAQSKVSLNFETFLSNEDLMNFNPVLIHGDFGSSNILWDSKRGEISGIIDFGETEIGDPAYDFAGLLSSYGKPFIKRCLSLYPEGSKVLKRINFYKSTFALQEALHGIENSDKQAFENGIKTYR